MDLNSFKERIAEVYEKQFISRTYAHLNKIYSLFKPEFEDFPEGGHSGNRKKYFEEGRVSDIVDIISRSMPYIANKENRLKILDLGCGFGEFSAVFRTFGHEVVSVNGGEGWYLDDFRYVCDNILDLNYFEMDLFDIKQWALKDKFDYVFASEILTLEAFKEPTKLNKVLEHLYNIAEKVVIVCHKGRLPNFDRTRFFPEIHRSVHDNIYIVTFYTNDTYKELADRLIESGKPFGHYIYASKINDPKEWGKAVSEKPRLIKKYYYKFGSPVLYLDADCEIIKPLDPLIDLIKNNDLCIRERNLHDKYNLGVMGFGTNEEKIKPFLEEWTTNTKLTLGTSATVDQKPLESLLKGKYKNLKVHPLHAHYNFLPADGLEYNKEKAVILHHKESKTNQLARSWRNKLLRES